MKIGIELLALRIELLDPVAAEDRLQVARGQFDALDHRPDRRLGVRARFRRQMLERAREIVDHGQHVAREARHPIGLGVADLALGAPAQVLHLGQRAQHAILQLAVLGVQRLDHGEGVALGGLGLSVSG